MVMVLAVRARWSTVSRGCKTELRCTYRVAVCNARWARRTTAAQTSSLPVYGACSSGASCRQGLCPAWILAVLLVTLQHAARWNAWGLRVGGVRPVRACLAVCCTAGVSGLSSMQGVQPVRDPGCSAERQYGSNQPWLQLRTCLG